MSRPGAAPPAPRPLREQSFGPDEPVMVSVAMIAYQVEAFLAEAIESVLDQVVDFRVELVIGEDCSRDRTREIARSYVERHPTLVRVLEHPRNLGLTPNSVATQNACRGRYVALLDGDDYWTHPEKLLRQVRFLEAHPDHSASSHQAHKIFGPDYTREPALFGGTQDADLGLADTLRHRKFHTSSLVYRRELWVRTGGIPTTISSNERAIYPMLALFGPIRYMAEPMCVYRLGGAGLSSRITAAELSTDLAMIPWLKGISPSFPAADFRSFLHLCAFTYPARVSVGELLRHWLAFTFFSFATFPRNLGDVKHGTHEMLKRLVRR